MRNRKRLASIFVGIALATGVASLASEAIASADPDTNYLYDLNNAGIGGPSNTLLGLGHGACNEAHQNVPRDTSIANIGRSTNLGKDDASFLYDSALHLLCP